MRNFVTLTIVRMRLALRNRLFIFFSLIMPLCFFFFYLSFLARGLLGPVKFFLGPVIALTVMGSFWGLSSALVTFREQGILRRFRVAPVTEVDMLASSIVANYFLTLPTLAVEIILARWIYHVTDFGNPVLLVILVTLGTVSFASLGLVVASVANTMQETQIICQIIWFALIFLSGATLPFTMIPLIVQRAATFLPATYLVLALQVAIGRHADPGHLFLVTTTSLLAWAVLAFFVAAKLFRWESEEKVTRNAKVWAVATILPFILLGAWESKQGGLLAEARSANAAMQAGYTASPNAHAGR